MPRGIEAGQIFISVSDDALELPCQNPRGLADCLSWTSMSVSFQVITDRVARGKAGRLREFFFPAPQAKSYVLTVTATSAHRHIVRH